MTNLVKSETAMPAVPIDDLDPLYGTRPDELAMPVEKIVQPTSRGVDLKRQGEYHNTLTDAYSPKLRAAILRRREVRSLFQKGVYDQPPLCSSDDAITPNAPTESPDSIHNTGPTCAECHFSRWGSAGESRKGQACQFTQELTCWNLDTNEPFRLRVHGTSLAPFKIFWTIAKLKGTPLYAVESIFGTTGPHELDGGVVYIMSLQRGSLLDAHRAAEMRELARLYRNMAISYQSLESEQTTYIEADGEESVLD